MLIRLTIKYPASSPTAPFTKSPRRHLSPQPPAPLPWHNLPIKTVTSSSNSRHSLSHHSIKFYWELRPLPQPCPPSFPRPTSPASSTARLLVPTRRQNPRSNPGTRQLEEELQSRRPHQQSTLKACHPTAPSEKCPTFFDLMRDFRRWGWYRGLRGTATKSTLPLLILKAWSKRQ